MIKTKNLCFQYNENSVLNNLNFRIGKGERTCIIGRNGSGKTTILKLIAGLIKPTKGEIIVNGTVGIVFQNPDHMLFETNVKREVSFGPRNMGLENIDDEVKNALEFVGLQDIEEKDPLELSFGQRKRVSIASVISMRPNILLLDEPGSAQDLFGVECVRKIIDNYKGTVLIVSHNPLDFLEVVDRTILIERGSVFSEGGMQGVLKEAEKIW